MGSQWSPEGSLGHPYGRSSLILSRHLVSLPRVAGDAGADHVFPDIRSSLVAGNHVVDVQVPGFFLLAAILAGKVVPSENILPRKLDVAFRQAVVGR